MFGGVRVTLVTGTATALADRLYGRALAGGVPVVRYRLPVRGGSLMRTYVVPGTRERVAVPVGHCTSCTLREDIPRLLRRVGDGRLLLVLPENADPLDAAVAVSTADRAARVETVALVAEPADVADDLARGDLLADRGLAGTPADRRTVADVLARQAETADLHVTRAAYGSRRERSELGLGLLAHLSPWALPADIDAVGEVTGLTGKPRFRVQDVLDRTQPGGAMPVCPEPYRRVSSLTWSSRRPFHPARLLAALDEVMAMDVRRARGHAWLASRPLTIVAWESAGPVLSLEPAGRWLHAAGPEEWRRVTPIRRTVASLEWDPDHGDRRSEVRFTGVDLDPAALRAHLDAAVLTDTEMAAGEPAWARLPDPFGPWLGPPAAEPRAS